MRYIILLCLCCLVFLTGCPKHIKTYPVTGTVKLDGEPLDGVTVKFSPVGEGHPSYGRTGADGTFVIQTQLGAPGAGTTPGEYKVTFTKMVPDPKFSRKVKNDDGEWVQQDEFMESIPAIYSDSLKSTTVVTIVKGKNNFDFDLDSKAK